MRCRFDPWVGKITQRRKMQPTPLFLPAKPYGQRSLTGCSPKSRKELDTTENRTCVHTSQILKSEQTSAPSVPIPYSFPCSTVYVSQKSLKILLHRDMTFLEKKVVRTESETKELPQASSRNYKLLYVQRGQNFFRALSTVSIFLLSVNFFLFSSQGLTLTEGLLETPESWAPQGSCGCDGFTIPPHKVLGSELLCFLN